MPDRECGELEKPTNCLMDRETTNCLMECGELEECGDEECGELEEPADCLMEREW